MTPAEAYRAGVPGYYVVEPSTGDAIDGPRTVGLLARGAQLALEQRLGGRLIVVLELEPAEVAA